MEIDKKMLLKASSIFMVLWGLMSILDTVGLSVGVSFGGGIGLEVQDQFVLVAMVLYSINAILEIVASVMGYFYFKVTKQEVQHKMLKTGLLCSAAVIAVSVCIMFLGDVSQVNWLSFVGTMMVPILYLMSGSSVSKAQKKAELAAAEDPVTEALEHAETVEVEMKEPTEEA